MAWSFTGSLDALANRDGTMQKSFRKKIQSGQHGTRDIERNRTGNAALSLLSDGNIFYGNQRVGYLDEADTLFGMNRAGHAVRIGPSDRRTACDMLREWLAS